MDAQSIVERAVRLARGTDGVQQDIVEAVSLLERAISGRGNVSAMFNLAVLLQEGAEGVERDVVRAVSLYERAIDEGRDVRAMFNLANLFKEGAKGVRRDAVRAVSLYERAIRERGLVPAMFNLALLLHTGAEGVERDIVRAVSLYKRVIHEGGFVPAMFNLAALLHEGAEGVERDAVRAVSLYERAIREGRDVKAMFNLANLFKEGAEGIEQDAVQAVSLYERAIREKGDISAMVNLAKLLCEGAKGVRRDVVRAVSLYERAISGRRNVSAMFNLAVLLQEGAEGVQRDVVRAVSLYERAISEGGYVDAMASLALILRRGEDGVPRDVSRAIDLLRTATEKESKAHHMHWLACILLSDEIGDLRSPLEAKALLERSTQQSNFGPAMLTLAMLLQTGDEGVERDEGEAQRMLRLAHTEGVWEFDNYSAGFWAIIGHEEREQLQPLIGQLLETELVKLRRCFLLVLGGAARGKTSVIRSLRNMEFVQEHRPTELVELNRFVVLPGQQFEDDILVHAFQSSETFFAAMARIVNLANRGRASQRRRKGMKKPSENLMSSLWERTFRFFASLVDQRRALLRLSEQTSGDGHQETESAVAVDARNSGIGRAVNGLDHGVEKAGAVSPTLRPECCVGSSSAEIPPRVLISASSRSLGVPDVSSSRRREKIKKLPEKIYREVLLKSQIALETNSFPQSHGSALVQCWDAAGQHPYEMAHYLSMRRASILLFVTNLAALVSKEARGGEIAELCRWLELAHALVVDPAKVRPIIVGTRMASCGDVEAAWRFLKERLRKELGEGCYNSWIREVGGKGPFFIGIENSIALSDRSGSGVEQLERLIKKIADSVIEERDSVQAKWVALIEKLQKMNEIFFTKEEVEEMVQGFPGFGENEPQSEIREVLRYFGDIGQLVLMEVHGEEYFVFPNPEKIVDLVRQVTGPVDLLMDRVKKIDAERLEHGLLSRTGLEILWKEYTERERQVVVELLCRFDLLMRVPYRNGEELIAIPALLPAETNGLRWAKRKGETELVLRTELPDVFPPGMIGLVIAHLHRTVGDEHTNVEFVRSVATILSVRGDTDAERGNVFVEFDRRYRRIIWTVRAVEGAFTCARRCLQAFEECVIRTKRIHYLTMDCKSEPEGCGRSVSVEFALPQNWIMSSEAESPPNLHGKCNCGLRCFLHEVDFGSLQAEMDNPVREQAVSKVPSVLHDVSVFISHAGEQKQEVAYPIRDSLRRASLQSFLDDRDLRPSTETVKQQLSAALRDCKVAVFVLTPDFVSKKWTMWELREMLKRKREAEEKGERGPGLLPLFYKVSVEECKDGRLCERYEEVFERHGFFEESRLSICSKEEMLAALRKLAEYPGEIKKNDETSEAFVARAMLRLSGSFRDGLF